MSVVAATRNVPTAPTLWLGAGIRPRWGASSCTGFAGVASGDPQAARTANRTHSPKFEITLGFIDCCPGGRISVDSVRRVRILPDMAAHRNALALSEFACDAHATNTLNASVAFPSGNPPTSLAARK